MIKCFNYYCIYWENNKCRSDTISISHTGNCNTAILIPIPPNELEAIKNKYIDISK